jgi:hypothetical protein
MQLKRSLSFCASLLFVLPLMAQSPAPPKTTQVLVTLTVKPGIAAEKISGILPEEVRATVRLYLDDKIREWFSRADGKGVVFILNCSDVADARTIMEQLPLARQKLVDYEYTPLAPLAPLGALLR